MASLLASLPLPLSRILVDTSTGDTLEWARGQREASQRLHDAYVREWLRADIWLDSSVAEMELVPAVPRCGRSQKRLLCMIERWRD